MNCKGICTVCSILYTYTYCIATNHIQYFDSIRYRPVFGFAKSSVTHSTPCKKKRKPKTQTVVFLFSRYIYMAIEIYCHMISVRCGLCTRHLSAIRLLNCCHILIESYTMPTLFCFLSLIFRS